MVLRSLSLVYLLSWMALFATGTVGDEWLTRWRTLVLTGTDLGARGRFAEAEAVLNTAWRLAETVDGSEGATAAAITVNNLAALYTQTERFREAERALDQGIRRLQERLGADDLVLAALMASLSNVYVKTGQLSKAQRACSRIAPASLSATSTPEIRRTVHTARGRVLHVTGRYLEAEQEYRQALLEAETGESGPLEVASALTDLGVLEFHQRKFQDATLHFRGAMDIYERTGGSVSPTLIQPLIQLAWIAKEEGRSNGALVAMERAVAIAESTYGNSGSVVSRVLSRYAILLRDAGQKKRAAEIEARVRRMTTANSPATGEHTVDVEALRQGR